MDRQSRIVFFGSGPVAATSLELLIADFNVTAVVTKPKPLHHQGTFPVIDVAQTHNLPLHTVSNRRELSTLITTKPFVADVAVPIDFGIIVGQDAIDYFPRGIINSHFSLLPDLRGADPITFSILSGQKQTGVSLMLLVEAMDEGPIIACGVQELSGHETTPELTSQLIQLSHALLREELPRYLSGESTGVDQAALGGLIPGHPTEPSYSRKLAKDDGVLDFSKPAAQLEREVRAFIEWPKSRTEIAGRDVVIISSKVSDLEIGNPGDFAQKDRRLYGQTTAGSLELLELKPAGKQVMDAAAFLAGYGQNIPKL